MKILYFTSLLIFCMACTSDKEEVIEGENPGPQPYTQVGVASYYANFFEGRETASGDKFSQDSLTAAHKHLPLGTTVKVVNLENEKEVTVKINDRGPYVKNRIIDLSKTAAKELEFVKDGKTEVLVEVVDAAPGYTVEDSVASN